MRSIPDPGFAGDDGSVPPEVAAALAAYDADPRRHLEALAVVQHARVLVPVVAVLGELEYDDQGRPHDKTSDMATVLVEGADGRRALLAFTGTEPLRRWNPDARPVPVAFRVAAQSAVQDGADAMVLDIAGPALFPVEGEALRAVADGHTLVRLEDGWGWARPA
ncbi:MAG TPA: SseB family protein [Marmoricola sp.]|nr:SseB family protein [Marmoricola sp.]